MATLRAAGAGLALGLLLTLAGCAGDPAGPGQNDAEASIRVSANVSNTPIDLIVVTVTAADFVISPVFNLPVMGGVATGTVRIPPGPARTFTVTAFDSNGEITHDGSATRDVQRGQNPPLAIPLTPRAGQVPLTISFGDFSVIVEPAAAEIDLSDPMTAFVQLTVTVTNAEGLVIESPDVLWATTDPSRALVGPQGFVSGVLAGEVDIVATYNGIAGISHITLTGAVPVTWFEDADGDGYGNDLSAIAIGSGEMPPPGYVTLGGDCDDGAADSFPGALEFNDGFDNDCDGMTDEQLFIADADGDQYGEPSSLFEFEGDPGPGYILFDLSLGIDCNDLDANVNPGEVEIVGDGTDNNCDGLDE